jgi:ribose 5-phosphate isomerase B
MTLALGSDHAGFLMKELVKKHLEAKGHEVRDCGTDSTESVDYPDYIFPAAESVAAGKADLGIVVGGSGNGEAIAANKVKRIRCAVCWNIETARLAKEHNDANMIALGARIIGDDMAIGIVDTWLESRYQAGRHAPRIKKISDYEDGAALS